jgi:hypothetical protein
MTEPVAAPTAFFIPLSPKAPFAYINFKGDTFYAFEFIGKKLLFQPFFIVLTLTILSPIFNHLQPWYASRFA